METRRDLSKITWTACGVLRISLSFSSRSFTSSCSFCRVSRCRSPRHVDPSDEKELLIARTACFTFYLRFIFNPISVQLPVRTDGFRGAYQKSAGAERQQQRGDGIFLGIGNQTLRDVGRRFHSPIGDIA
jgi:hypothetical protein